MRRIVYWRSSVILQEDFYVACSRLTPLVEPAGPETVFMDLSGCHVTLPQLTQLSCWDDGNASVGVASNKITAQLASWAVNRPDRKLSRIFKWSGGKLAEIAPGQEKAFLASLPLELFFPLDRSMLKKLRCSGFDSIADLADIPPYELVRLLGDEGLQIAHLAQGKDLSPVVGLYPPHRMVYPVDFIDEVSDHLVLEQALQQAVSYLSLKLHDSHQACQRVILHADMTGSPPFQAEKLIQVGCNSKATLFNILAVMLRQVISARRPVTALVVTLDQLVPVSWSQPDLFCHCTVSNIQEREDHLDHALKRLENRFPGFLTRGMPVARREQVLSLWDPWRTCL